MGTLLLNGRDQEPPAAGGVARLNRHTRCARQLGFCALPHMPDSDARSANPSWIAPPRPGASCRRSDCAGHRAPHRRAPSTGSGSSGSDSCHSSMAVRVRHSGGTRMRCSVRVASKPDLPASCRCNGGSRVRLVLSDWTPGWFCERPIHRKPFGLAITFRSSFIEASPILESGPRPALTLYRPL
jgi:hypothetical protein